MKRLRNGIGTLTAGLLLAFALGACGVKGPVLPPLSRLPAAPQSLAARQIGERLLVSWGLSKSNQDGSPLQDLQGFVVYRNSFDPGSGCPDCGMPETPYREIDLEYLQDVTRSGDRLVLEERDLTPGSGYFYRIVPITWGGKSGKEASLQAAFQAPPPPPAAPVLRREEGGVRLTWMVSDHEQRQAGFVGYNIYRRQNGDSPPSTPLNGEYWLDITFLDTGAVPGVPAAYTLRSVWRIGNQLLESGDSAPAVAPE